MYIYIYTCTEVVSRQMLCSCAVSHVCPPCQTLLGSMPRRSAVRWTRLPSVRWTSLPCNVGRCITMSITDTANKTSEDACPTECKWLPDALASPPVKNSASKITSPSSACCTNPTEKTRGRCNNKKGNNQKSSQPPVIDRRMSNLQTKLWLRAACKVSLLATCGISWGSNNLLLDQRSAQGQWI